MNSYKGTTQESDDLIPFCFVLLNFAQLQTFTKREIVFETFVTWDPKSFFGVYKNIMECPEMHHISKHNPFPASEQLMFDEFRSPVFKIFLIKIFKNTDTCHIFLPVSWK